MYNHIVNITVGFARKIQTSHMVLRSLQCNINTAVKNKIKY